MPIRRGLIVMFGLTALLALPPAPAGAKNRKGGDKEAAQPFVVETRISAPKRIGEFELESSHYDPAAKHAGASFRYQLPDRPQIRFDLFVYPAGDMSPDTAMAAGMKNFVESFDAGVKMKYYSDLKILDTIAFEIPPESAAPASDGGTSETSPRAAENEADAKRQAIVEAALAPRPIVGKRIDLHYTMRMHETDEMVPMRSHGYLFYKQLYYFKGRISVAESLMDQTMFDTLSDRAMRELVPAVHAANIGSCSKTQIVLGGKDLPEGDAGIDAMMAQLLDQVVDSGKRGCHASRADAKKSEADNAEVITIEYDPDDWTSK